ncbi:MAG: RNA-directed DNA polymerase [Tissierellaceae bacterium]|nr:RNA-directed DNA polymerase [Tissierellaceae bacterium]
MEQDFLKVDNFTLAFNRLQTITRDYYKEVYISDLNNFGLNLTTNINTLIDRIKRDLYRPGEAYKIYLPKLDSTVRVITLLSFIDLLVYQAIINVLADTFYPDYKYKTNKYTFGNIYNDSSRKEEKIYFYTQWTKQWRKYNIESIKCFNKGYKYKCDFDIASFYDTIDHSILIGFIEEKMDDGKLLEILKKQLKDWSCDHERISIKKNHGIPQGPKASGFLAEIVLNYIDEKMIKYVAEDPNLMYLRYVDDISIFATDEDCGKRALAYLDLLSRDIGLIPQSRKLGVKLIESKIELINDNKKISKLSMQYRRNGKLKDSLNRKLINNVIKDINIENLINRSFDKSLLKFAMYKAGPDRNLKNVLIENIRYLYAYFDDICYYLSKNFIEDPNIRMFVYSFLNNKYLPYNYLIAIIFKHFGKIIDFDIKIYEKYYKEIKNRDWYIRYFMLDWINIKNPSVLNIIVEDNNFIVKRKLNYYRYWLTEDIQTRELIIHTLLEDKNVETALLGQGLLNMDTNFWNRETEKNDTNLNEFIKKINNIQVSESYISNQLNHSYGIANGEHFFNNRYWSRDELTYISKVFKDAQDSINTEPSVWLAYINTFNHLITVKLLEIYGIENFNKKEFNNILEKKEGMPDNFPKAFNSFSKINSRRNEIPLSHPYDREGKIGKHISKTEKTIYKKHFTDALEEILTVFEGKHNLEDLKLA